MATVAPARKDRRPADRRVRRPHRRDARQHGAAAPQHARRAAPGAAHRRRGHLRGDAAPGLPAPLRREDRRERHADPVHPLHRPHGLPGRDEHEPGLLAGGREAVRHEDPGEGEGHPRHHRRDEPHRQPPRRHGGLRPRPRHVQPVPVRLPRARDDPRPVRGGLRRPADLQLHHHRRRPRRPARGLGRSAARSSSTTSSRASRSITRC